jgi:hypothetical protein
MTPLRCSFCNRTVNEVERIVTGPDPARPVHICNNCVEVCAGILRDGAGQDDAHKRFNVCRPIYDNLRFTIAVLILVGIVFCVRAYLTGGISHLEETAAVWVMASVVAILLNHWLQRLGHANK